MLTNNTKRKAEQVDAANPRAKNAFGHIIEITEADGDFAADQGQVGSPAEMRRSVGGRGRRDLLDATTSRMAGSACPTIAPSMPPAGSGSRPTATATEGHRPHRRALGRRYRRRSARHLEAVLPRAGRRRDVRPAASRPTTRRPSSPSSIRAMAARTGKDFGRPSYYEDLSTRWPDFKPDMPVRPSVVAITRKGGGKIGV